MTVAGGFCGQFHAVTKRGGEGGLLLLLRALLPSATSALYRQTD